MLVSLATNRNRWRKYYLNFAHCNLQWICDPRSSGMLRSAECQVLTYITGQPTVPTRIPWLIKMGTVSCPKTSVRNYHFTLHNIPEEHRSHLPVYCDGSLNHTINLAVTGIWLLLLLLAFGCFPFPELNCYSIVIIIIIIVLLFCNYNNILFIKFIIQRCH
jgi:hypothetical protein